MTLRISPAEHADAPAVASILHDWTQRIEWMPNLHTAEETGGFAEMMIARGWVSVAKAPDVTGFISLEDSFIHALYVTSTGQGIGRALLDDAKSRRGHLSLWTFVANEAAQRFYLREGFIEAERTNGADNDENLPDIRYVWDRKASA